VSGRGDLEVYCAQPVPGPEHRHTAGRTVRYVTLDRQTYRAYVYGRRVPQMSQKDVPLHGIAIDQAMALHEELLREIAPEEAKASWPAEGAAAPRCGVCGGVPEATADTVWADFGGDLLAFCSGAHFGELSATLIKAEDTRALLGAPAPGTVGTTGTNPPPANPINSLGTKKVLYVRVIFPDDITVPTSESAAADTMQRVNDYYVEASYNKTALMSTIAPLVSLPHPKLYYSFAGPGALAGDAAAAAVLVGYNRKNYDLFVIRHTTVPGFDWGGLGGGGTAWLQYDGVGLVIHELGHNYGLAHANFWDTRRPTFPPNPNNLPFDPDSVVGHETVIGVGDDLEYGDIFDIMGSGGGEDPRASSQTISAATGHFNPVGKNRLGWLPNAYILDARHSQTSRIYAFDVPRLDTNRAYAMTTEKDALRRYWVSVRSRIDTPWMRNGVELRWGAWQQCLGYSDLLDTTPDSKPGRDDAPLILGRTFSDREAEVHITPVAKGGAGGDLYYDVVINRGPFPGNSPPVVQLTASTNRTTAGTPVTLTAQSTDPDRDELAYFWDFGDGTFAPNAPTTGKIWTQAGDYVVRCEVSDRKGGMTSKHLVVRVGNPTTLTISGRVIADTGQPLRDVRISNGALTNTFDLADNYGWTYTDSDGAYTLVGLPAGGHPIGAFLNGYDIVPFNFELPVTLGNQGADNVLFLATPLPKVTVEKDKDVDLVAKTPGGFVLRRTGDTNRELTAVFLLGGDASAGRDYMDYTNTVNHTNTVQTPFGANTAVYKFYQVTFATGAVTTNITIAPPTGAAPTNDRQVRLTVMYPLQAMRLELTNSSDGTTTVTNTNWVNFTGWEVRAVKGQDTWFQRQNDYIPGYAAETNILLRAQPATQPIISILALDKATSENPNDSALFVITRAGDKGPSVDVELSYGGTAEYGSDYEPMPRRVTLRANETLALLPLVARPDAYLEGHEKVVVTVLTNDLYRVGTGTAEVTILDNDLPTVTLAAIDAVALEAGGDDGVFEVTRSGDMARPLVVNYLVTGTAISGLDYRALPGTVTIAAGQPSATFTVVPRDNMLKEGTKTVVAFLSDSTLYNVGSPGAATVFIQEKGLPTVRVIATDADAAEPSDNGEFEISRVGDLTQELLVKIRMGGTAKELGDYAGIGTQVRIPPGQARVLLTLFPINDRLREDVEYAVLEILPSAEYNIGPQFQARINVDDDDGSNVPGVGFNFLSSTVIESAGAALVAVSVSANPAEDNDVTVDYKVTGGSALPEVDYPYNTSTGRLVFPHNPSGGRNAMTNRTQLLVFPIMTNDLLQPDRSVVLTLIEPFYFISNYVVTNDITITNAAGEPEQTNEVVTNQVIIGTPMNAYFDVYKSHTLTIKDDDAAVVTLVAVNTTAEEEKSVPGVLLLKRAGATNRTQAVKLDITGSATMGSDFEPIPFDFTFPVGVDEIQIAVIPVDDPAAEFMESVTLTLIGAPGATIGAPRAVTVNIIDNDGTVEFPATAYSVAENAGFRRIPVRRTGSTNVAVTVQYAVTGGTATPTADFLATNGTLTFLKGEILKEIEVTLVDDQIVEPTETVNLTLQSGPGGAPLGGQTTTVLSILDDDSAVEFAEPLFRVNEHVSLAWLQVRRLGVITNLVRVDLLATNGSATDGLDFVATNVTLIFSPGVTNITFRLRILNDTIIETNELVALSLTNVTGSAMLGTQSTAGLLIVEDDCDVQFASSTYLVDEYARIVAVTVERRGGTVHPVDADFASSNLTAIAGKDYLSARGTVSFTGETTVPSPTVPGTVILQPGETNRVLEFRILDDVIGEGNEDFLVALTNARTAATVPAGTVTLGLQTNTVVTIVDNETPGSVDYEFNVGQGPDAPVRSVGVQPDRKIVFGGDFAKVNDVFLSRIARVHEDGYLDSFFNPGAGASAAVLAIAVQPDSRLLVGGNFTQFNGVPANRILRLNADGTADAGFRPGAGADGAVRAIAVAPDGKVVLGGDFNTVAGQGRSGVALLAVDGTLDAAFNPNASGGVLALAAQPDGKILVGGGFTTIAGAQRQRLARLNPDGTLDASFNTDTGPDGPVQAIAVDGLGRILIGGSFNVFNGVDRKRVARLNPDGSLDTAFDPGSGANDVVLGLGVQPDGKVIVGGAFTNFADNARNRLVRLNPNGTIDTGFDIGSGANGIIRALAVQPDTAIVIGGDFTQFKGLPRRYLARIHGDEKFVLNTIQFASAFFRVKENTNEATLTVLRSGDLQLAASVDYATSDGTATAGADYTPATGRLDFAAGETEKTFKVKILDDQLAEGDETVNLVLTNLPLGFALTGTHAAVLTIEDDESAIAFASASYSANENAGVASILVRRSGPSAGTVSVDFSTRDGTAKTGQDYTAVTANLQFVAGETEKTVDLPILDDTDTEEDETVLLELRNAVGAAVLGSQTNAVLTIVDNDRVEFYSLIFTPPFGGSVTPVAGPYPAGSTQVLTASADRDYRFVGWEGTTNSAANPLSVFMDRNYTLTAKFLPTFFVHTFEAPFTSANLAAAPWVNSTTAPWTVQSEVTASGKGALRSGPTSHGEVSALELAVDTRAGAVTFDVRVSSEQGHDWLEFYVNGVQLQRWSGDVPWRNYQFNLAAGRHRLLWRYRKDNNFSAGLDAGFIDNIYLPLDVPDPTPAAAQLTLTIASSGASRIQLTGKVGLRYVLEASPNLQTWTPIATNVLNTTSVIILDQQALNFTQRYYRAVTP